MSFLPVSQADLKKRGITQPDFVYISGDAYIDHASFGTAIISRVLERYGYSVGIIAQPDWKDEKSITVLGRPRLAFLVSAGNMDSMVNHYTVSKKKRGSDSYSPGGRTGLRPDRAVTVYGNLIRKVYKDVPVILGGIEASLRRFSHYDYWSDHVRRSVLLDSAADLISYGMGERSIVEIADALDAGIDIGDITFIRGTLYKTKTLLDPAQTVLLPSFEEASSDKAAYNRSFRVQYENTDAHTASVLAESYGSRGYVVQNPPAFPLSEVELDDVYELPYMNRWHPMYDAAGGIPAFSEIRFSLTSNRGCFGGCNFCALTFHQGRTVSARSKESLMEEALRMTKDADFKGYIHDVGGPTANFFHPSCEKQKEHGVCKNRQCLFPTPCKHIDADQSGYTEVLESLRALPGVKKVFVRSGIRYDYALLDSSDAFLRALVANHVSGQLRVAPEHVSDRVLHVMGKPSHGVYEAFLKKYYAYSKAAGKEQYALPYFMSSHPGSTLDEAVHLAEYIRDMGFTPEQAQDFYPTPATLSTCIYYTGVHPMTGEKIYTPKSAHEKHMQRALIQYRRPENYELVREALIKTGRTDLIGTAPDCLIPYRKPKDGGHHGERTGYAGVKGGRPVKKRHGGGRHEE